MQQLRLPGGIDVRTDTYVYDGCYVPGDYDPLIAKLIVWAPQRDICVQRLRQALRESSFAGISTNLPFLQRIMERPTFIEGSYASGPLMEPITGPKPSSDLENCMLSRLEDRSGDEEDHLRYLSIAAVIAYLQQNRASHPHTPDRLLSGWHRQSRLFPG